MQLLTPSKNIFSKLQALLIEKEFAGKMKSTYTQGPKCVTI
jgi:hypothetical protein